tara:strand:- start:17025 stop:17462 length:438 start_codon:yes stop_codon:yes gene_type:complete
MATDNIINGTLCVIKTGVDHAGATAVAFSTSGSISLSMDTRDISNKSSAGWRELLEAQMSWSASVEGLYAVTDSAGSAVKNYNELYDLLISREPTYLELSSAVSGDTYYSGQVYLTSLEQTAPLEDNMTYSATFEGTAALNTATV